MDTDPSVEKSKENMLILETKDLKIWSDKQSNKYRKKMELFDEEFDQN